VFDLLQGWNYGYVAANARLRQQIDLLVSYNEALTRKSVVEVGFLYTGTPCRRSSGTVQHSTSEDRVVARRLLSSSEQYSDSAKRIYEIRIIDNQRPFGYLHITPEARALVWDGTIKFANLERRVLNDLRHRIFQDQLDTQEQECYAVACLILSSQELVRYDLRDPKMRKRCLSVVSRPNHVRFARFDVQDQFEHPNVQYSFTAENARFKATSYGELALRLTLGLQWSAAVISWVFQHHSLPYTLLRSVGPKAVAHALSTVDSEW
jgi:hypothetical protein